MSNFKSNFMREADSENSNLNMLQQKISDMIGNQFKNDVNNRRYEEVINAEAQAGEEKIGQTFELEDGITDEAKEFMKASFCKPQRFDSHFIIFNRFSDL